MMTFNVFRISAVCTAVAVLAISCNGRPNVASISDFNIQPDSGQDVTAAFRSALEACRKKGVDTLRLSPGRYDFWPDNAVRREIYVSNTSSEEECPSKVKTLGVLIEDQENLVIDGCGAELMFHGKMTMLAIIHSRNITVENLEIDCFRPGGSEIVVEEVEPGSVTVRFKPDSWYEIDDNGRIALVGEGWKVEHPHCIEFDPETGHMTYSDGWDMLSEGHAEELEPSLVRFDVADAGLFTVGNVLTVRDHYRDEVGILNLESWGVTFRNVGIRYMHAIGAVSQFSRDVTYDHVYCEPREGSGRILASSADFLHFSGCAGKVRVLDCRFSGAQDDPVNVHGTYLRIDGKLSAKELRLRFMHPQTYGMQAFWKGDTVSFVNAASLQTKSFGVVADVQRLSDHEVLLTLENDVPEDIVPMEDFVENLTWTPEVEIRGCRFARTSTRGTLVTTPRKVVIADNEYIGTGMAAILISGDASGWYESGAVKDVTITGNRFIGCNYSGSNRAVITIEPTNRITDPEHPVHTGISISGNYFKTGDTAVRFSKSAEVVMEDNDID